MPIAGRTIRLFLADGSANGVLTAEIMNWTGHLLSAPRARIVEVLRRPEASRTGVYFLIGADPEDGQPIVYVGESDNVGDRLAQHNRDETKSFWETTCIITNKDANLTKAHVRYLESRIIQLATQAAQAKLQNSTAPQYGYLPESDISDMEYFLDQLQTLLPVLGIQLLKVTPQISRRDVAEVTPDEGVTANTHGHGVGGDAKRMFGQDRPTEYGGESPIFCFADGHGTVEAFAAEVDGQMVIFKGSTARDAEAPSLPSHVRLIRQQLRQSGKLVPTDIAGVLRFEEDVAFSSPSAASQAIMGTSRNGRIDWKVGETGETYATWQETQIAKMRTAQVSSE